MKLLLALALAASAGRFDAPSKPRRDRAVDVLKLTLELTPDLEKRSYTAVVTHKFKVLAPALSTLELDAADLDVTGASTGFEKNGDKLILKFSKPLKEGDESEVRIDYRSTQSHLGLHFFKKDPAYPGQPDAVWSKGETERTRFWIPLYDYPNERLESELIVAVPEGFSAISNGRLAERGPKWRWVQDKPHAPYLITLSVGRFDEVKLAENMTVWAPQGRGGDAPRTFSKTPAMVKFYEELTATPYPWAKFDQVLNYGFRWGGMEDTSAVMLTDRALLDERAALDEDWDGLISHELAHQWFGDYVTCKDWSHMWLNEGFADFFAALWTHKDKGEAAFEHEMDESLQWFAGGARRPLVTDKYQESDDMFDANSYGKGAWILQRLRRELGEDAFWASLRLYLKRHGGQAVESEDLRLAIEDATGKPMEGFFRQWVYNPGHPELTLSAAWDPAAKKVLLTVKQKDIFRFTTAVELDGKRFDLEVRRAEETFALDLPARPKTFRFDPDFALPAEYTLDLPEDWLLAALRSDESAAQRLRALRALAGRPKQAAVKALKDCALKDPFWGVAAACVDELKDLPSLLELAKVEQPKVRKAVAAALGKWTGRREAYDALLKLTKDKSYFVEAAALQGLGGTKLPEARAVLEARLSEDSYNDVIRKAALAGLGALGKEEARPALELWAGKGKPVGARLSALSALAALGGEASRKTLEKHLLEDEDRMVRQAAAQALGALGDPAAVDALLKLQVRERDPRIRIRALESSTSGLGGKKRGKLKALLERAERLEGRIAELEK